MVLVSVGCRFESNAAETAVDILLWRKDVEKLNDGDLFGDIVCGDGVILCEAAVEDESGDPNDGERAGRLGPLDEDVKVRWRFERVERSC